MRRFWRQETESSVLGHGTLRAIAFSVQDVKGGTSLPAALLCV